MGERIDPDEVMDWRYSWCPVEWSFTGTWKEMFEKMKGQFLQYCTIRVSEPGKREFKKIAVVGKSFRDELIHIDIHDEIKIVE